MVLYMDNKGGVDIFNSWSIAGNTRAISVQFAFICKLKEAGILKIEWIQGHSNSADLYAKNLSGPEYNKHVSECKNVAQTVNATDERKEECQDGWEMWLTSHTVSHAKTEKLCKIKFDKI